MRYVYLSVLVFLLVSALLFTGSFFYLDIINHKTYHYLIQAQGKDVGTIRIDRFFTEEKIIYKAVTNLPFEPLYTEYRSRLVLDKSYRLENYTLERLAGRSTDSIYLEDFKSMASFISRYNSKFAFSENIPVKRDAFIFEEDSPMTYLPIIANYNFSSGRSQGFSTLSFMQSWSMPPMKRLIILTSIKDEYIKVGHHKIKAENLILKMRDFPQGAIWVSKSDRSILRLELPARNISIVRTFSQRNLRAVAPAQKWNGYLSKEIIFKSKGADLSATLTSPSKEGRYPAVLLSPGSGPQNRDYQGLFAGIADYLSRNGYACLRFDKRGVGSSGGESASTSEATDAEDLSAALQCLAGQDSVDPDKIILIGHGRGAITAMNIAANNASVKGLIMMSPLIYPYPNGVAIREDLEPVAKKSKWTDEYLNLVLKTVQESHAKAASVNGDWSHILGKRCFMGSMREDMLNRPVTKAALIQIPVLVLKGHDTDEITSDTAAAIDRALSLSRKAEHTLTYYAYLGPLFGPKITSDSNRSYYETDGQVLENIQNWLYNTLSAKPVEPVVS